MNAKILSGKDKQEEKTMVQFNINIENITIKNITVKGDENALPKENESSQVKSNLIKRIFLIPISLCVSQIMKLLWCLLGY